MDSFRKGESIIPPANCYLKIENTKYLYSVWYKTSENVSSKYKIVGKIKPAILCNLKNIFFAQVDEEIVVPGAKIAGFHSLHYNFVMSSFILINLLPNSVIYFCLYMHSALWSRSYDIFFCIGVFFMFLK
jgi:hypothetical protein